MRPPRRFLSMDAKMKERTKDRERYARKVKERYGITVVPRGPQDRPGMSEAELREAERQVRAVVEERAKDGFKPPPPDPTFIIKGSAWKLSQIIKDNEAYKVNAPNLVKRIPRALIPDGMELPEWMVIDGSEWNS